jgi:hypothetical protein
MYKNNTHLVAYIWAVLLALFTFLWLTRSSASEEPIHFLELELNNPYRFGVELEVKCDWNEQKKNFDFHKFYFIKPGDKLKVMFPKYHHECQIWPDHSWHFINKGGE